MNKRSESTTPRFFLSPIAFSLSHTLSLSSLPHVFPHADSLFPTMYLVLKGLGMLYSKEGEDLCNSLNLQDQPCKDTLGFIIMATFVEMVSRLFSFSVPAVYLLTPRSSVSHYTLVPRVLIPKPRSPYLLCSLNHRRCMADPL